MRNNYTIIIVGFFVLTLLLVTIGFTIIPQISSGSDSTIYIIFIAFFITTILAYIFNYFTRHNRGNSNDYVKSIEDKYEKLEVSNERYDIVSKATSDTIGIGILQQVNLFGTKEFTVFLDIPQN